MIQDNLLEEIAIKIENCDFTWKQISEIIEEKKESEESQQENNNNSNIVEKSDASVLKKINLNIRKGEFIGLIGEVGSGKSSLLQAIINNLVIFKIFS